MSRVKKYRISGRVLVVEIPCLLILLATAIARLGLSARAYHRVLKMARTCADLAAAPEIRRIDVAEAVNLRALDRLA